MSPTLTDQRARPARVLDLRAAAARFRAIRLDRFRIGFD
jgi:hypothetical protein